MNTKPTQDTESIETTEGLEMFWGDKPTELPSVLSGFTPAPDVLIRDYGYITALVWGKVWRYCQMGDGVCRASIDRIAEELGMSDNTIMRHLKPLCDDGYLYDSTPERRNKPHIYSDTGRIRIKVSVEAKVYYPTESHRQRVTPTTPQSHSDSDRESLEESIKKESKKEELSPEEIKQANQKVDKILELNKGSSLYWKGREFFRDNHLGFADWYNGKTGQVCGKKVQRAWQKAFSEWQDEGLSLDSLEEARVARLKWKAFISDPNELTKDAVAIQAQRNVKPEEPDYPKVVADEDEEKYIPRPLPRPRNLPPSSLRTRSTGV